MTVAQTFRALAGVGDVGSRKNISSKMPGPRVVTNISKTEVQFKRPDGRLSRSTFDTMTTYTPEELAAAKKHGDVVKGVAFKWWLVNSNGAGFALFREPRHSDADIRAARDELKRSRDVVGRILVKTPADTYKIVRLFKNIPGWKKIIKEGVSLEEAKEHCRNPETDSKTCTADFPKGSPENSGPWFDGFEKE